MSQKALRKRRNLSAERKYSILEELKQTNISKAEILRREGLYSGDIQRFEKIAREGALDALSKSKAGRPRKPDVSYTDHELLKKELARKESALSELATEFVILKKKVDGE